MQDGALGYSLPHKVNARLCPPCSFHGAGVRRSRNVAVFKHACTLSPVSMRSAGRERAITDVTFAKGAARQVRLRIAAWAYRVAATATRPGLGGSEPAPTAGTCDLETLPLVDEGLGRLGAGENDAHVGILNLSGIRPASDGSHRESRVADQGPSPVVVATASVYRRIIGVDADESTVARGI